MSRKKKTNRGNPQHPGPVQIPVTPEYASSMADWYDAQWNAVMEASRVALDEYYGRGSDNDDE